MVVMARLSAAFLAVALAAGVAGFYYRQSRLPAVASEPSDVIGGNWLEHLHSQNPKLAREAIRRLQDLGASALPEIRTALKDPSSDPATKKAALKAAGLLGHAASTAVPDVAAHLSNPELTEEAAVALSFMGPGAYAPLREAASSSDPVVRREALRSLGKLHGRARLQSASVIPLLLHGLADSDRGVRAVSATYLGIIHENGASVVPALIETLQDEEPEVRAAAATALGSFEGYEETAVPALRKAAADSDENVAREAGLSIVKLQSSSRR